MKIAVVADVLGAENNGTTIAAMNLIRSLKAKGHEVRVVCPDIDKKDEPGYYIVPTLVFKKLKFINRYIEKNQVTIAHADQKIMEEALKDVDIVHSMVGFSLGIAALKYCRAHHIPFTTGFHAQAENITSHFRLANSEIANFQVYSFMWHHYFKYADAIHYPTQFIRDLFEGYFGHTNGFVISNGVHRLFSPRPLPTRPSDHKFTILMIGRYSYEKNQLLLYKAMHYSKHQKDVQIIFAGQGPVQKKMEKAGKKLINPPILGFYHHEQLRDIIDQADLYVHTANIEIESISCLEAISSGLVPLISNSKLSAARYFALESRSLFEADNPRDLAKKIDYWFENQEELIDARKLYLGFTDHFAFEHCMDLMEMMIIKTYQDYHKKQGRKFVVQKQSEGE